MYVIIYLFSKLTSVISCHAKKGNATQPSPTMCQMIRSTAATLRLKHNIIVTSGSNRNTIATSWPTHSSAATLEIQSPSTAGTVTSTNTSKTPNNTSVGALQQQSPQTQQPLISQLSSF